MLVMERNNSARPQGISQMTSLKSESAANAELARAAEFAKLAAQYGWRAALLVQSQRSKS